MESASSVVLLVIVLVSPTFCISKSEFYEYGLDLDHVLIKGNGISSAEIALDTPITFYGESYSSIFVNSNGLLSFLTDIPTFYNIPFPLDYPIIAPLYTNVDTSLRGNVYYRETQNRALLNRIANEIHYTFPSAVDFLPLSLFVATWDEVGYYKLGQDKVNSYQAVIASDGTDSFVKFLYLSNGVQWSRGTGDVTGLPDAHAQAGMVSGDGRLFTLPGSGSDQVQYLDRLSNIGNPGGWMFRIGEVGDVGNVSPPEILFEDDDSLSMACSSIGSTTCHSKAECIDYDTGFCCSCQPRFYGNGVNCLPDDVSLRVNGKLSGSINDVALENLDIQSYVVTPDGRTYTAISRVPQSVGYDMQILNIIGGVIGWLFARPLNNAPNGFQLTGGVLNHTSQITFPLTGHKLIIQQKYIGLDVFDQLKLTVDLHGTIPTIPLGTKIQISEYEEQYIRTEPGIIISRSSQSFRLEGVPVDNPFDVEQTIHYEECLFDPPNVTNFHLKVARNLITYEAQEKIIRYGMTSKVSPPGDYDPCQEGHKSCVEHSSCIVEGDTFRCVCNPGYQYMFLDSLPDSAACIDINECSSGTHNCDINALCVNEEGSYSCRCNAGYTGNGYHCEVMGCSDIQCHQHATCMEQYPGHLQCQCLEGFIGDGINCEAPISENCNEANNCSPFATCHYDQALEKFACVCIPGYSGDGYSCVETYAVSPKCDAGDCWCPKDFELEGLMCVRKNDSVLHETQLPCNIINTCHPHAQCGYSATKGYFECHCNAGYEGDGYECTPLEVSCLEEDICDIQASCQYDDNTGKHTCICNEGYQMDGRYCTPIHECQTDSDCGINALCTWSHQFKHYQCICHEGFNLYDGKCQPKEDVDCKELNDCHPEATCMYNIETDIYECKCNQGYVGDGKTCQPYIISCNILNHCGPDADCVYDQKAAGYRCRCRQGLRGNGTVCVPETTCLQNPGQCGRDASCTIDSQGSYICQCNEGFIGNGVICKKITQREDGFLLLNQGMTVLRVPINPSAYDEGRPIILKHSQEAVGIDIDCLEGRVYWSDINGNVIRSGLYNGSDVLDFLKSDLGSLEGISIDWISRNIYWTDSTKDTIEVANIHSKLRKVLISEGLVNPRGIAAHPRLGKLFWSDWNRDAPKLEWSNLDGSERALFLDGKHIGLPNSLAIDWDNDELCWADAGTHVIGCVAIHSRRPRTVVTDVGHPFGLAISSSGYYWTDWKTQRIEWAQKPYGQQKESIRVPLGGIGKLYGIVAVEVCRDFTNACQFLNGFCDEGFLCLPNGPTTHICACADSDYEGSGEPPTCDNVTHL